MASNPQRVGLYARVSTLVGQSPEMQLVEFDRALSVVKVIRRPWAKARTLSNLALCFIQLGDTAHAVDFVMRALAEAEAIQDHYGEAGALSEIGVVLAQVGQSDRAVTVVAELGDQHADATALCGVARAFAQAGNNAGLNCALSMGEAIDDKSAQALALSGLAQS